MDPSERDDLVDALMSRLEQRGAPAGATLADLMRLEQDLMNALSSVRRLTAAHVNAIRVEAGDG